MARRVTLLLVLALVLAAPALAGDGLGDQKASVDSKLSALQSKIAASKHRASALDAQIGALIAMWPDAVEQKRLAERYAAGAVAA